MCWEDVKIWRNSSSRQYSVAVGVASTPVLPPNPRRIAVVFVANTVGAGTLSMDNVAVSGLGVTLENTDQPTVMHISEYGGNLRGQLNGIGTAPTTFTVVDVEVPLKKEEALREGH